MKGKLEKKLPYITQRLSEKFIVETKRTEHEKHASQIASDACGKYDLIIAAGGDGIVNEVVSGVAEKPIKPVVAILPFGTVNDFSRSLNISRNLDEAIASILNFQHQKIDCLKANDSYGCYVICAGTLTETTYLTKQRHKKFFGWFAYLFRGIRVLFKPKKHNFEVTLDGQKLPAQFDFVLVMNSLSVAGFKINKSAALNDGVFDIVLIKKEKGLRKIKKFFILLKVFLFGIRSIKQSKSAIVKSTDKLEIKNKLNSLFNIDGDKSHLGKEIEITILKQEIEMITNF